MKTLLLSLLLALPAAAQQNPPIPSIAGSECWELYAPSWNAHINDVYCPGGEFVRPADLMECKRALETATFQNWLVYGELAGAVANEWADARDAFEIAWGNCAPHDDECRAAIAAQLCEARAAYQAEIFALWDNFIATVAPDIAAYKACVLAACTDNITWVADPCNGLDQYEIPGNPILFPPFAPPVCTSGATPSPICVGLVDQQFDVDGRLRILEMEFEKKWFSAVQQYQLDVFAVHLNTIFVSWELYCAEIHEQRAALHARLLLKHAAIKAEADAAYVNLYIEWANLVRSQCCDQ